MGNVLGGNTRWAKYFVGNATAGNVRFQVHKIVLCLPVFCPRSILPAKVLPIVFCQFVVCPLYIATSTLPSCTLSASVLPTAGTVRTGKVQPASH